jgi:hypothetical protein
MRRRPPGEPPRLAAFVVATTPGLVLEQYFAARRDALPVYLHLATAARALDCRGYAIKAGYDGWEYALAKALAVPRLEHAFVLNASTEIGETPLAGGACLVVVDEPPDWPHRTRNARCGSCGPKAGPRSGADRYRFTNCIMNSG